MIVSPAQLETEADTAAERLLEEIDANQDADDGENLCGNQIYVECRFLTARRSQRGHVIAEKRLSGLISTQATTTARSRAPSSPLWPRASSRAAGVAAARAEFTVSINRPTEALEDDEHPWWYMTAR